jgi:hypothetical protein
MISESTVKVSVVNAIRKEGGYARRIEDKFTVGMPDLILIPLECPVVWVEVKLTRGSFFAPSPRQFIELVKLNRPPHSVSLVMAWKDGHLYVSTPKETVYLEDCFKQEKDETVGSLIRRALANG